VLRSSSRFSRFLVIACAAVVLAYVCRSVWLPVPGRFLVRAEAPDRAEVAVVLAGVYYGHRIVKAAELANSGYVKKVLVSGPSGAYGHYECDLAIEFAVAKGYPKELFIPVPNLSRSTREEAIIMLDELRRMGVHKFLVVTSNFHTRRTGAIYRSLARDMEFRVVAAPDEYFNPENWYQIREARKVLFFEWVKTLAEWVGM